MRGPDAVKRELIALRWTKKLPLVKIAKDSGCSPKQVMEAMQMVASETICRRLDAYLDAGHLHKHDKSSRLLTKIERFGNELWHVYQARTIPMRDVQNLSKDHQERLCSAMEWRLKKLLREKVEKDYGVKTHFEDSASYWRCKAKILTRTGELAPHRKSPYRYGPRSVGEGKDLLARKNKRRPN